MGLYAPSNPTVTIFESMEVQIGLAERLAYLKSSISQSDWKCFHLDSIDNFIFHLPNIEK